jgi:hypothetical protein
MAPGERRERRFGPGTGQNEVVRRCAKGGADDLTASRATHPRTSLYTSGWSRVKRRYPEHEVVARLVLEHEPAGAL